MVSIALYELGKKYSIFLTLSSINKTEASFRAFLSFVEKIILICSVSDTSDFYFNITVD